MEDFTKKTQTVRGENTFFHYHRQQGQTFHCASISGSRKYRRGSLVNMGMLGEKSSPEEMGGLL